MITPYTERQKTLIVNNVVRACKNIETLNRTGYKFINLCSGFIAHYNLHGFISAYSESGSLKCNILRNVNQNQWNNFRPDDRDYLYYMSKKDVYNRIVSQLTSQA